MSGHECHHCKQWIEAGETHDCWTTTEAALTAELSEDLQNAWARLRETAATFGDQRIYASHKSIMFARASCYFFVRPKRTCLELCVFLGRAVQAPRCAASTGSRSPSCATPSRSGTATRWKRPSPTGSRKRTSSPARPTARTGSGGSRTYRTSSPPAAAISRIRAA